MKTVSKLVEVKSAPTLASSIGLEPGRVEQGKKRRRATQSRSKGQSRVPGEVMPEPSALARERVVPQSKSNPKNTTCHKSTKLVGNHAHQRLVEFPAESFKVDAKKLYYQACQMVIADKKSMVQQHITGKVQKDTGRGPSRHQVRDCLRRD